MLVKKRIVSILIIVIILIQILISVLAPSRVSAVEASEENTEQEMQISIPRVDFIGNIENMTDKSDVRNIMLKYESNDLDFEAYTKIKIQGSSSASYNKKNYTINLYQDNQYQNKKCVDVGWGEQSKYCLKANWIDKTHARNIVTARIVSDIQKKYELFVDTPNNGVIDGYPVVIYSNGEFLGLYTWNIPKDIWLFNMDEDNENHIVMSADGGQDETRFKKEVKYGESEWSVEVGVNNEETYEKFNRVVKFVKDSTNEEFRNNFSQYLNLDACLNYYIMGQYAMLEDDYAHNMLMVTYDGKIWMPSLYDLDTSWGTDWIGQETCNPDEYWNPAEDVNLLWDKLEKSFPNEIANRYFSLRKDILSYNNVISKFEDFVNNIPDKIYKLESDKYSDDVNVTFNGIELVGIPGCDIEQIKDWLEKRVLYLDAEMSSIYTIDREVEISYSVTEATNQDVIATVNFNRDDIKIINNEGKNTYTFKQNDTFTFEYQDWNGNNKSSITATVDWIDKDLPEVNVKHELMQENDENNEIKYLEKITISANEEIQNIKGWTISGDKKEIYKIYEEKISEEIEIKDVAGNILKTSIDADVERMIRLENRGDINSDKNIDTLDLLAMIRHIATQVSKEIKTKHPNWVLQEDKLTIADINKDGEITIVDILLIQRHIAADKSEEIREKHLDWVLNII